MVSSRETSRPARLRLRHWRDFLQPSHLSLRTNATIDWTVREQLRVLVKRILRKYGYPPDLQEQATQYEIEQAEQFSAEWAVG